MRNFASGRSEDLIILRNQRLSVEISAPGSQYCGSRYDWTGFITQVTLDGRHTFCGVESLQTGQGDGGLGLCNEFGIFTALDYEDAKPGDNFSKLGVGLLTRSDSAPYRFNRPYLVKPFPVRVSQTESSVHIVQEALSCRDLAARLEKNIRIEDNQLVIEYALTNTGAQPVRTEEYAHNYLLLNGALISPDYTLKLPPAIEELLLSNQSSKKNHGSHWMLGEGGKMQIDAQPQHPFYLRAASPHHDPPSLAGAGSSWEIIHEPTGLTVQETTDFPWWNFALYGTEHCVCPEVFIKLDVPSGQSQSWSRRYTFALVEPAL